MNVLQNGCKMIIYVLHEVNFHMYINVEEHLLTNFQNLKHHDIKKIKNPLSDFNRTTNNLQNITLH